MNRRLAIVTGGSTGIGQHLVEAIAEAGYAVAFSYRSSSEAAEETLRKLTTDGHRVLAAQYDVGIKDDV